VIRRRSLATSTRSVVARRARPDATAPAPTPGSSHATAPGSTGPDATHPISDAGPATPGPLDDLAARLLRAAGRRLPGIRLVDDGPAGRPWPPFASVPPIAAGETPRLVVHDPRAYRAVLTGGSVGLGESYLAGWWDADDLTAVVRALVVATEPLRRRLDRAGAATHPLLAAVGGSRAIARRLSPATARAADRRAVQAHYDLPGDLFAVMLDETMAYSCAVFERPGMSLGDAQRAKFDRICRKLRLGPTDHVVEIGTGWGGFAVHAAATTGCRVTTTTVSDAQRQHAVARIAREGLADRVTVLGDDYRDLRGRFDALVSIEMVEAVDWRDHRGFLATCRRLLADDGRMALQAIVLDDASEPRARHHADFIRALVFPGSCIPSVSRLVGIAAQVGLRTVDLEDIGRHYAETLRQWRANLAAALRHDPALAQRPDLDDTLLRLWDLYLAYCEAAFLERHVSDVQLVLAASEWRDHLAVRPR
jgi:cyclopropane-fatty-acyl-phospholipid synthase